jgi:dipeptidyl-peptidase-4
MFDALGQLWVFDLGMGVGVQVTASTATILDPKFSPDGRHISYVEEHNLYVRPVSGGAAFPLTRTNDPQILNGEVDWVYAEELDVRSNYFWSPDGRRILFLQMDERKVPEYPIVDWMPTHAEVDMMKYPKAGDPNPAVRLGVVGSNGGGVRWLYPKDRKQEIYIPRFGWVDKHIAYLQVLNRAQDQLDLYFVDVRNGRSQLMLTEKSDTWIEIRDDFRLLKSGGFLWTSWRDGFTHIYLYSFNKDNPLASPARMVQQLTRGEWEVTEIDAVDEQADTVYFTANEGDARERHLYSVSLQGGATQRISREAGTHDAEFSPNAKQYVNEYSATLTAPQYQMCSIGGGCTTFWRSQPVDQYAWVRPEFVDFKTEDGTLLHGELFLPPEPAPRGEKVPIILNPYGGPHGQMVQNTWPGKVVLFSQVLAQNGFAVLSLDNRGSGGRGRKFEAALRHNFGEIEFKDQMSGLAEVRRRYPLLDPQRAGIWGWSYGGFMTLYAMTHSDVFDAGVSVAPVTDWLNYDTIYTERYMGLPSANLEGYKRASPVHDAASLRGRLLLVHGTSDDNVHMQNSVQMVDALVEGDKQFDLMIYPGKTHGIAGEKASVHLFRRILQHFERELKGAER